MNVRREFATSKIHLNLTLAPFPGAACVDGLRWTQMRGTLAAGLVSASLLVFLVFVTNLPSKSISGVGKILADLRIQPLQGLLTRAGCTLQLIPMKPLAWTI